MAHFRGTVSGGRTQASRLGHKSTGLETTAASWQGAAHVRVWHDASSGTDMVVVALTQHHGAGVSPDVVLYRGPVGEYAPNQCTSCCERGATVGDLCEQCDVENERNIAQYETSEARAIAAERAVTS